DVARGFPGAITALRDTYFNFGKIHVAGFDGDVSYKFDTGVGEFTPAVALANVFRWRSAIAPGAPESDNVSKANQLGVGFAPRWKGTVQLGYLKGLFSTTVIGRYTGRYLDYQ